MKIGIILYTFTQFHSTPAIITSILIGVGIVFCGCAMVHNVFVWQREKTICVRSLNPLNLSIAANHQQQPQNQLQTHQSQTQQQQTPISTISSPQPTHSHHMPHSHSHSHSHSHHLYQNHNGKYFQLQMLYYRNNRIVLTNKIVIFYQVLSTRGLICIY